MIKIFISYARVNSETTKKIANELETDHTIGFDLKILDPGDAWNEIINNYIEDCDVLILLWSNAANNSKNVINELDLALEKRKKIIPILIDQTKLHENIVHLNYVELNDDNLINKIKKALKNYESGLREPKSYRQGEPVPIKFIDIPAGDFRYSKSGYKEYIKRFQLAKFPITVREYRRFARYDFNEVSRYDDLPVTNISWDQATEFCKWVKNKIKQQDIRLPTEKEWEYAAKAGVINFKYATDNGKISREYANYKGLHFGLTNDSAFPPNPFGILSMSGNVWEWCLDEEEKNADYHVVKGGSWRDPEYACQCSFRLYFHYSYANIYTGFRVMKVLE